MKKLLCSFLLSGALYASMISAPTLSPDSISLDAHNRNIGAKIFGFEGSTWLVGINDNAYGGDWDFNDLMVKISFGAGGRGQINYVGANDNVELHFANQIISSSFTAPILFGYKHNDETVLQIFDASTGYSYFSGPKNRNWDFTEHVWARQQAAETPEPATSFLIGVGLSGIVYFKRRRNK